MKSTSKTKIAPNNALPAGNIRKRVEGKDTRSTAVPPSPKGKVDKLILPPLVERKQQNVLEKLKEKTVEIEREIGTKEAQSITEKRITLSQLEELNREIDQNNIDIKKVSNDNQILFQQLKEIKNEVDDKMKFLKILKVKEQELDKNEQYLQSTLRLKETELNVLKKNIETSKKDRDYYERLVQINSNEHIIPSLTERINELKAKEEKYEKELLVLDRISKIHKSCDIKQRQLQTKLTLIKNEYEFEVKRHSSLNQPQTTTSKHSAVFKYVDNEDNKIFISLAKNSARNNPRYPSPLSPEMKDMLIKQNNLKLSVNPIIKKLDKVNENYKKNCLTTSVTAAGSLQQRHNSEQFLKSVLFKTEEKELLEQLIPYHKLQTYEDRFKEIETQKNELEYKLKNNNVLNKIKIKENKEKYDYSSLQIKEQNKRAALLNNQRSTIAREIVAAKTQMKSLKSNLAFYENLFKVKKTENEKLLNHLDEIEKQKNRGELILKPNEVDNDDEEEQEEEDNADNQREEYEEE